MLPVVKARNLGRVDDSVGGVNTGEINLGGEFNSRGVLGIARAGFQGQGVNTVFVITVRRAQNGSVPISHVNVISIGKA